ncbi:MAG: heterodisulfide reductase-related iron-sulfur binding cluster [candidate division KSB1 bacterium]|nr:heterodisulfide reductase-related iron-sulfur binding cluster [candidate division KSB1 bacterium]
MKTTTIDLDQIKVRKAQIFPRGPNAAAAHDLREELFELEAKGEIIVQRVPEPYVEVQTKFGRTKKIPIQHTWHHKSCGQCGHIPGYSTSIFWLHRQLGLDYLDPTDQTSCTGWNYYASATSNAVAQAAVMIRNFAAAYETGYFPLIHCGTSFGHYKECREQLVKHQDLRDGVRRVLDKLGKPLVIPEEIVHYSEWVHAMRHEFAKRQVFDLSDITACVHPACHYHKIVPEDAIYDWEVFGGQRTATVTGLIQALGAKAADYSTWFDCCGFGFRHVLVQRDFTRSFAVQRKIEVMIMEANPDVVITHDTGCVTTLDKSQFSGKVHNFKVGVPVLSDAQLAALAMGAHPFRVLQLHWHSSDWRPLLQKLGIEWEYYWEEFQQDLAKIRGGEKAGLTWEDADTPIRRPAVPLAA